MEKINLDYRLTTLKNFGVTLQDAQTHSSFKLTKENVTFTPNKLFHNGTERKKIMVMTFTHKRFF